MRFDYLDLTPVGRREVPEVPSGRCDMLPGMLVASLEAGAAFVAITIAGVEGTGGEDAGLASGVLNAA